MLKLTLLYDCLIILDLTLTMQLIVRIECSNELVTILIRDGTLSSLFTVLNG